MARLPQQTCIRACNGPDFVLQLHFHSLNNAATKTQGLSTKVNREANARLKCNYFPIIEGKENIERILEKLRSDGLGIKDSFETFGRVSIRRLGRLLPDARWIQMLNSILPLLRLIWHITILLLLLLKTLEINLPRKKKFSVPSDISVDIYIDGKKLTLMQLEKEYQEWILKMLDAYDEEIDRGRDQPDIVLGPPDKKMLGITSDDKNVTTKRCLALHCA